MNHDEVRASGVHLLAPTAEELQRAAKQRHGRMVLIVFSGEFDRWMAAFSLATTAAASGAQVSMFFTFWGVLGLRRKRRYSGKSWLDRLLTMALPAGCGRRVTRMNMGGLGAPFFAHVMRRKNVASLEQLIDMAQQLGVKVTACQQSLLTMGVEADELIEGVEIGGAACAVDELQNDASTLFI